MLSRLTSFRSSAAHVVATPDGGVLINDDGGSVWLTPHRGECVKLLDGSSEAWSVADPAWRPHGRPCTAMRCNTTGTHVALRYREADGESCVAVLRLKGSSAAGGSTAVAAQVVRVEGDVVAMHWCPAGRAVLAVLTRDWRVALFDADDAETPLCACLCPPSSAPALLAGTDRSR